MNITDALAHAIERCEPRNQHDWGCFEEAAKLKELLYILVQEPKIPSGYVLVPENLTPAMRFAFNGVKDSASKPDAQWRAMLAARPEVKV